MSESADIFIIGAGPAGLTAAIYSSRAGVDTFIAEKAQPGGQLWLSESIENYPGFPDGVPSSLLSGEIRKQAEKFGARFINGEVTSIKKKTAGGITVSLSTGETVNAVSVIVASGASMSRLGVKGEETFSGRGVSYCAVCDGPLYKGKRVAVVGGGNTACEEAVYMTRFAEKVYLIHRRSRLRAIEHLRGEVERNSRIELVLENEIEEIKGDEFVTSVKLKDREVEVDGVFIFVGLRPSTDFLDSILEMDRGFIVTDRKLLSSEEGIYAAGDCRAGAFRQVVTACGDGALAAEEARIYVEKKKGTAYDW